MQRPDEGSVIARKSNPRAHLSAHPEALQFPAVAVDDRLAEIVGRKYTAYSGIVKDVRTVDYFEAEVEIEDMDAGIELVGRIGQISCALGSASL
jgi:hypothetical protein